MSQKKRNLSKIKNIVIILLSISLLIISVMYLITNYKYNSLKDKVNEVKDRVIYLEEQYNEKGFSFIQEQSNIDYMKETYDLIKKIMNEEPKIKLEISL